MAPARLVALWVLVVAAFAGSARAEPTPPLERPIQVMILGVYHFGNPGRDLHNTVAEDVTTPRRQAELADVAKRLERFQPTRIAVESVVKSDDLTYAAYHSFKPADLLKSRNETVQIGCRVAHDLGLTEVYGIDEDGDFPYDKVQAFADRVGGPRAARLAAASKQLDATIKEFTASQRTQTIAALLAWQNEPSRVRAMHELYYYDTLELGDARAQPGADLNAAWYLRNAKIFTKLLQIAKPGDRVIVIFGAGHAYWLRHFAQSTPGVQLVGPNAYLTGTKP